MDITMDRESLVLLGTLNGKMDAVLMQTAQLSTRLDAQDTRIDSLENSRSWMAGILAVIALCADKVWSVVSGIIGS